ncbi:MAG TPA: hypothetical protein VF529_16425 [Solirubrobacteraceae bacterium]|jgi:adenine/guanine phosphoribosyltransferase-like PRPP-binding protein
MPSARSTYSVFFAHNFSRLADYIEREVRDQANSLGFDIRTAPPGVAASSPPDFVRDEMRQVEGLLVIAERDTNWLSNEIGIAYAFELPVYVLADSATELSGITRSISSVGQAQLSDPAAAQKAVTGAFRALADEIERRRRKLPQPIPERVTIEKVDWVRFFDAVYDLHRALERPNRSGGFHPSLVLGIPPGGVIVADLLCRFNSMRELGLLKPRRLARQPSTTEFDQQFATPLIEEHVRWRSPAAARILIADDVLNTGETLAGALAVVNAAADDCARLGYPRPLVKSLVLMVNSRRRPRPDYCAADVAPSRRLIFPYGIG